MIAIAAMKAKALIENAIVPCMRCTQRGTPLALLVATPPRGASLGAGSSSMSLSNLLAVRSLLKAGAAGLAATALPFGIAKAQTNVILGIVYVGPKDDFGWNQAHAGRGRSAEGAAGHHRGRGRERARDRRRRQVDGVDDQPRRRQPRPRDLVRLLQPVRRRPGEEISGRAVPPCGAAVERGHRSDERRLLLPLSQPGALRERRRRRPARPSRQDRLRRGQADPVGAVATSTRCCSARARSTRTPPCR